MQIKLHLNKAPRIQLESGKEVENTTGKLQEYNWPSFYLFIMVDLAA